MATTRHYVESSRETRDGSGYPPPEPTQAESSCTRDSQPCLAPENRELWPDGAGEFTTRASTQCLGSFCLFFSSWGLINSYGVFESFYTQTMLEGESPSRIAWIGSVQAFLIIFGGIFTGPLVDSGHAKALIRVGGFLIVFGMVMTSLSTQYWQLMLAQGVVVGLGSGALFVPSVAILPLYFVKHRALSMGIGAAGVSVGGLIFPVVFRAIQPHLGFAWTTRIIAFIVLAAMVVPVATMRPPSGARAANTDRRLDMAAWKEPAFSFFAVGTFLAFTGLYIPYFYVQLFGQTTVSVDENLALYLVSFLNAGALFGRVLPNYLADRIGAVTVIVGCCLGSAILGLAWIGVQSTVGLIVLCVLYGFFSGGFISLGPTVVVNLCPSLDMVGRRMGLLFGPCSIGLLIGNPIAGAILQHGWVGLQTFCGVILMAATAALTMTRFFQGRKFASPQSSTKDDGEKAHGRA